MLTQLTLESVRDRALVMRAMSTFEGIDDDSLALVASYARARVFPAGAPLMREHQVIDEVFAVVRGKVAVMRNGREVRLPDPAPAMVGLLPILARDPQGFDAVAEVDTVVLALPTQVVLDVLEEHFAAVRQVLRLLARTLLERLRGLGGAQGTLGELLSALPSDQVPPIQRAGGLSRVEALMRLRAIPILESADLDALFAILDHQRELVLAPGEALWRAGDRVDVFAVLEEGRVRAEMTGSAPVVLAGPSVLGRLEALAGEASRYSVIAETEARFLCLRMSGIMSVLESHFDLARKILAGVSGALLGLPPDVLFERTRSA